MKTLKSILFSLLIILSVVSFSNAQDKPIKPLTNNGKVVKDTTISNTVYKLYVGAKGGKYVVRTSKKTGKEYKQYFKK